MPHGAEEDVLRTYGKMEFVGNEWKITAEPHVMIRLKAVLGRVNKRKFGDVALTDSPEVCRDLEWFISRYPLEVGEQDLQRLIGGSTRFTRTMQQLEEIRLPGYTPSFLPLAKPAREYQAQAVDIYLKGGGLLLADELGLGKSITAIASFTEPKTLPALVVCAPHIIKQWGNYIAEFLPGKKVHVIKSSSRYELPAADVYIITYHKLCGWADVLREFIQSVVFDEIQELRHNESAKYGGAEGVSRCAKYRLGLSATPIYNYGGEIFNIIEILKPGHLGTRDEFEREWCEGHGKHTLLKDAKAFGAYLRDSFLMVQRTRREVGRELPPAETVVQQVSFNENTLNAIDAQATELAHRILQGQFEESGLAAREFDIKLRQATGISKAPYVAEFVTMLIKDGGCPRVLLTGWHREVYEVWKEWFRRENIMPVLYTGSESPSQKTAAVETFASGRAQVMMMSLRSGVGLDGLQEVCDTIVHGELDWSPAVHGQCRGRLERDGQRANVREYYLVSDGGSDPVISDILGLKTSQIQGLLGQRGGSGLEKMQTEVTARVKRMAEAYLERKGILTTNGHE